MKKLRHFIWKLRFFSWAEMVDDKNGRPSGIVWLTACTGYGNFRLIPIGYIK